MPKIFRLGSTNLTFVQREYLYAAVARGYTRNQVRAGFRSLFNIGFSNATFSQARRAYNSGVLQAARANLTNRERQRTQSPVNIRPTPREYRTYQVQGSVTVRNFHGDEKTILLNFFQGDNSLDTLNQRVGEIVEAGNQTEGSDWSIVETTFGIIRGVASRSFKGG